MRNGFAWTLLLIVLIAGNVYAEGDISICPKVSDIRASKFKTDEPRLAAPYNEGYTYNAGEWHGETLGAKHDYLDTTYELRADSVEETDNKTVCIYRGTTLIKPDDAASTPYLKLIREK